MMWSKLCLNMNVISFKRTLLMDSPFFYYQIDAQDRYTRKYSVMIVVQWFFAPRVATSRCRVVPSGPPTA